MPTRVPTRVPNHSPWIEQLGAERAPQPLAKNVQIDVAVIGAGIAGAATAFHLLHDTDSSVLLIERDRMGRGATGHNAGQLTSYFERPLSDLVDAYGFDMAIAAQRAIDGAWDVLDRMVAEAATSVRIDRFVGHMGMFTLDHLRVHLGHSLLRQRGGLSVPACVVADDAPFLNEIPVEFDSLYSVVPQSHVRELLGVVDDHYCAVLSEECGCANGALLVAEIVDHLQSRFADRFLYVDHTPVRRVTLARDSATMEAGDHRVTASRVVMCTNGFTGHVVENLVGPAIGDELHHRVSGTVGYIAAFVEDPPAEPAAVSYIRNAVIGGSTPYAYLTRRRYERPQGAGTLTCIGGPEAELADIADYTQDADVPLEVIDEIDNELLPLVGAPRPKGLEYDFAWHGVMAYTATRVRLIGFEPRNPVLMYNLGCNGVGFLPSIYGGSRIAQLLRGEISDSSIFDPP